MRNTLIVAYKEKDEIAVNQLRKLIEKHDDTENKIIGIEDGSVQILQWEEKTWLKNKGTVAEKALIIDDVKGYKSLLPVIDVKYSKHGILYGWAGSHALLMVDKKAIQKKADYATFLADLEEKTNLAIAQKSRKVGLNLRTTAKVAGTLVAPYVWPVFGASFLKDTFSDLKLVRQQMLCLGVTEFYLNHLSDFLKE